MTKDAVGPIVAILVLILLCLGVLYGYDIGYKKAVMEQLSKELKEDQVMDAKRTSDAVFYVEQLQQPRRNDDGSMPCGK